MEENQEQPGVQNPAHMLAKRLQENRKSLHIARIPDKTKEVFITLAESDFCGDYGMTLKWLMDDILSQDTKMIITQLQDHEVRILNLEQKPQATEEVPDTNVKKMCDGSKKVVRRSS